MILKAKDIFSVEWVVINIIAKKMRSYLKVSKNAVIGDTMASAVS